MAGRSLEGQWCAELSMFLGRREGRILAAFPGQTAGQPPLAFQRFNT